jgi:hypothetical protein
MDGGCNAGCGDRNGNCRQRCGLDPVEALSDHGLRSRNQAGGHSHTVTIDYDGAPLAVDIGFIVYNELNYPLRNFAQARYPGPGDRVGIRLQDYRDEREQRYVFPGGMLPSPQVLKSLGERFGVPVIRERIFGQDYAKTLAISRSSFRAA